MIVGKGQAGGVQITAFQRKIALYLLPVATPEGCFLQLNTDAGFSFRSANTVDSLVALYFFNATVCFYVKVSLGVWRGDLPRPRGAKTAAGLSLCRQLSGVNVAEVVTTTKVGCEFGSSLGSVERNFPPPRGVKRI